MCVRACVRVKEIGKLNQIKRETDRAKKRSTSFSNSIRLLLRKQFF